MIGLKKSEHLNFKNERIKMIAKTSSNISIIKQCELLSIPRSSWYYEPCLETEENLLLMKQIDRLHLEHPYYGVLRVQAELSTAENH